MAWTGSSPDPAPTLQLQVTAVNGSDGAQRVKPPPLGYYLGLPAWGFSGWTGSYFPQTERGKTALNHSARVFNTVEGNPTFYRVPDETTFQRWCDAVAGTHFHFSFKIPQTVTHERQPDWDKLDRFLRVMKPMGEHLGPFLVQCPACLGPSDLESLEKLFRRLPTAYRYALELRHSGCFAGPALVEPLLEKYNAG